MDTDWTRVKNFERKEWRMKPDLVSSELIYLVDDLTTYLKEKNSHQPVCIIHVAYENTGHSEDSEHYRGLAVDLHFNGLTLIEQYLAAERFPFTGIGVYPYWNQLGLHLDVRELKTPYGARWGKSKEDEYVSLNGEFMREVMRGAA